MKKWWKILSNYFRKPSVQFSTGFLLLLFSLYCFLSQFSFFLYYKEDLSLFFADDIPSLSPESIQNWGGYWGARLAGFLIIKGMGIASFWVPFYLGFLGLTLLHPPLWTTWKRYLLPTLLSALWISFFLTYLCDLLHLGDLFLWGGAAGVQLWQWSHLYLGAFGTFLLLLISLTLLLTLGYGYLPPTLQNKIKNLTEPISIESTQEEKTENAAEEVFEEEKSNIKEEPPFYIGKPIPLTPTLQQEETSENKEKPQTSSLPEQENPPTEEADLSESEKKPHLQFSVAENGDAVPMEILKPKEEPPLKQPSSSSQPTFHPKKLLPNYQFPPIHLLNDYKQSVQAPTIEELNEHKEQIVQTLQHFGIAIKRIAATPGPTVTLYEIVPEEGIKISKIRSLQDDIAMALSAIGIRIIAPIPGRGTIGIEVPNKHPQLVSFKSVVSSPTFQQATMALPLAIGKTIDNCVFVVDLASMPHLLIAGATGQGKSVGINCMIASLLYKKHPAELKFVMVDPKMVEMSLYEPLVNHFLATLPDLESPIITDSSQAPKVLKSLIIEMEQRIVLMKHAKTKNIAEYNQKFLKNLLDVEEGHRYLPYIVLIIDEFADLMATSSKEVELYIQRLAQKARSAGIHLIIATQRPDVKVITGTIKANLTARLSYRVLSKTDSRVILDTTGAEQLIGKGDCLFFAGSEYIRIQNAYISTEEVERLVQFIASQPGFETPYFLPEVLEEEPKKGRGDTSQLDPLFVEAARLIVATQQGSTSLLQRKLGIGYNRAGRIMDQLEQWGIVGPPQGSKPREVLIKDEYHLERYLADKEIY